ncbi:hematopoietic SH2 domain-containing protein, partial [Erinaceus europaeus]|uniref:Hematopoietic SH2 domain-containing protein n=1 Tax=Erinaceus europaeus TaxID=9365 RepID=A0ABM3WW33_ERIEU
MRSEALAAQPPARHRPPEPGAPPGPTQDPVAECQRLPPPLPPLLDWFTHSQAGSLAQGDIPAWFHGAISRQDAEDLLDTQPPGAFLVRVSHSHVGYTLSYRAPGCCRHFMVKLLDTGNFQVPGEPRMHPSLDALVAFHQQQPLRPHQQLLTQPCGQKDPENVDYEDLFQYHYTVSELAHSSPPSPTPCPSVPPHTGRLEAGAGPPETPAAGGRPEALAEAEDAPRGRQEGPPAAQVPPGGRGVGSTGGRAGAGQPGQRPHAPLQGLGSRRRGGPPGGRARCSGPPGVPAGRPQGPAARGVPSTATVRPRLLLTGTPSPDPPGSHEGPHSQSKDLGQRQRRRDAHSKELPPALWGRGGTCATGTDFTSWVKAARDRPGGQT